jgi:hypothetical protein
VSGAQDVLSKTFHRLKKFYRNDFHPDLRAVITREGNNQMNVPFTDLTIPKKTILDILWGLYPVGLFYGMSALARYNFITGNIPPPQGEILGMFLFVLPSFILSALLYKPVDSFTRSKRRLGTALYQFVSYPLEFAFYNTLMIGLQADNMPGFMQTNLFMFLFVLITSYLERIALLSTSRPQKIGQEVMQGAFVRTFIVFIVYMVSFFLFLRR